MIQSYSENCDYLKKRFNLPEIISLYDMVDAVVKYLKDEEEQKEVSKLTKEISNEKPKGKKRGRPRKKSNSN